MEQIARRIVLFRKAKRIKQNKLAEMAGISVTTLRKIERGGDTTVSTLRRIETALDEFILN